MRNFSSIQGARRQTVPRETRRALRPVDEATRVAMRWTVDQLVDPHLCALGRVVAIEITMSTITGELVGQFRAPCLAFKTMISALAPGDYVADAVLLDSAGRPRTTMIAIHPFAVLEGSELAIDIDFAADSFLDGFDRETIRLASDGGRAQVSTANDASRGESNEPNHASSEFESPETR